MYLTTSKHENRFPAQAAATLSTENVMMASSRAFASDAVGASASPPANAGGSAPSVSLGSSVGVAYENGTEVAADIVVDTQVQQWGYNVYAGSDTAGTSTAASLVSLSVSTDEDDDDGGQRRRRLRLIPRGGGYERRRLGTDDDDVGDDSPLTLVLQNVRPVDYGDGASEKYVNLTCPPSFVGRVSVTCPGTNSSVAVNCSGIYPTYDSLGLQIDVANEWSTQMSCAVTVKPTCLLWNAALQTYDSALCSPVNWTATNTTCACSADASAIVSEGGASFTSGSAALAGYFASMFDASNVLAALLDPNPLLLATFFTILGLVLINMVLGIRADMRDSAAAWTHVDVAKARHSSNPKSLKKIEMEQLRSETGVAETTAMTATIETMRTVANYANISVPGFLNDRSLCATFGRAILENHA